MRDSLGDRAGLAPGELGIAPDGGQRSAQLVTGVGGETAQPGLACRPAGQRGLDVPQHPVERGADLAELEPQRCYVSWDLTLTTTATVDAIRDVFIFVEDSCELAIKPGEEEAGSAPEKIAA